MVVIFILAGLTNFLVEVQDADWGTGYGNMPFHDALYFVIVSFSTVGQVHSYFKHLVYMPARHNVNDEVASRRAGSTVRHPSHSGHDRFIRWSRDGRCGGGRGACVGLERKLQASMIIAATPSRRRGYDSVEI